MSFETLLYETTGPVATVTLNRPDRLNTIVPPMPEEFETAIGRATLERDSPFGDYSPAGPARRPDPAHVINP